MKGHEKRKYTNVKCVCLPICGKVDFKYDGIVYELMKSLEFYVTMDVLELEASVEDAGLFSKDREAERK